jgi:hypothetical protein
MNETEWLACTEPREMLEFLERRASGRKLLLFAAACCRRAWRLSTDPRHRDAVEAAERAADDELSAAGFEKALQPVVELWANLSARTQVRWNPSHYMTGATRHLNGGGAAKYAASFAARGLACLQGDEESSTWLAARHAEEAFQCTLLRDIFGAPFRPFRLDPAWLSGEGRTAVELARSIEQEARFGDLPLLAEVLLRADCRDRAVLDHCRLPGSHVRGCWVLDALLGRESAVRGGLMTEADWRACEDPTSLLHFLRGKGTERKWRLFAVACCRRIDHLIADGRSRRAIEEAARYAEGAATEEALEEARAAAQEAQEEAKHAEWVAEAEENFRVTPRYAAVSRRLFAAQAARSAVCRDPGATDAAPGTFEAERWEPSNEWAAAAVRWDVYAGLRDDVEGPDTGSDEQHDDSLLMTEHGKLSSGPPRAGVEEAAAVARASELRAQCEVLHDLFGEFLGPPGDEGEWIPCGEAAPVSEWWCRLPTPRGITVRSEWMEWSEGAVPKLARAIYAEEAYDRLPRLADALEKAGCDEPAILSHLRGGHPHQRGCWVLDSLTGRGLTRPA